MKKTLIVSALRTSQRPMKPTTKGCKMTPRALNTYGNSSKCYGKTACAAVFGGLGLWISHP